MSVIEVINTVSAIEVTNLKEYLVIVLCYATTKNSTSVDPLRGFGKKSKRRFKF